MKEEATTSGGRPPPPGSRRSHPILKLLSGEEIARSWQLVEGRSVPRKEAEANGWQGRRVPRRPPLQGLWLTLRATRGSRPGLFKCGSSGAVAGIVHVRVTGGRGRGWSHDLGWEYAALRAHAGAMRSLFDRGAWDSLG